MSQLLQGKTAAFTDAITAPGHFWNGIPMEADGTLAIDTLGAIDHHHQGLPMTAEGRLAIIFLANERINNGAMPIEDTSSGGKLACSDGGVVTHYIGANGYTVVGDLVI